MTTPQIADYDDCLLEEILRRQHIDATIFTPFIIARLLGEEQTSECMLSITLRNIEGSETAKRNLRLKWDQSSIPVLPLGVQEKTVTEWAACGLAYVIVSLYTSLQIVAVAEAGDVFDYWVNVDDQDYGLEISGTLSSDQNELEVRHRQKSRQLLMNPYGISGFVMVVNFTRREVILSYHNFSQE